MIAADREALSCDLWEVYGIRDLREVPARTIAMLSAGLGENSRIRRAMGGLRHSVDTLMLAHIADRLAALLWDKKHRPASFVELLEPKEETEEPRKGQAVGFRSPEEFEAARKRLMAAAEPEEKEGESDGD